MSNEGYTEYVGYVIQMSAREIEAAFKSIFWQDLRGLLEHGRVLGLEQLCEDVSERTADKIRGRIEQIDILLNLPVTLPQLKIAQLEEEAAAEEETEEEDDA